MIPRKSLSYALGFAIMFFSITDAAPQTMPGPDQLDDGEDGAVLVETHDRMAPVWPSNIIVDAELKPFFRLMLKRSATFRRQWQEVSRARLMRVKVIYAHPPPDCRCRAMSIVKRHKDGFKHVTVHLYPPRIHDPELIAHEFEHALEQAEGLDLRVLAGVKDSGVELRADGSFETRRARRAGCQVADEFFSFREPGLLAAPTLEIGGP